MSGSLNGSEFEIYCAKFGLFPFIPQAMWVDLAQVGVGSAISSTPHCTHCFCLAKTER